jgi:hypothetical protein
MDTVRTRIETQVLAALASVTEIGSTGVLELGKEEPAGLIASRAAAGQWTVQVQFGDDDFYEGDRQKSAGVETWVFPVAIVVHLPVSASVSERQLRSDVAKKLVPLFVPKGTTWTSEAGNPLYGPEWNGLAMDTQALGGFGQGVSTRGTFATPLGFEIRYRHQRGDPTA